MISILPTISRIFEFKTQVGIFQHFLTTFFQSLIKFHFLIPILRTPFDGENRYDPKTVQKMKFNGVEISQIEAKSNKYPKLTREIGFRTLKTLIRMFKKFWSKNSHLPDQKSNSKLVCMSISSILPPDRSGFCLFVN